MLAMAVIFTSGGDCHKVPRLGDLQQQKLILSWFRDCQAAVRLSGGPCYL